MVESKFVVFQMIPHTLFIEWDFGYCSLDVLLFMTPFTSRFTVYDTIHYTVLFTYMVLFIRPVFFFKCSFLDLFNLKFYA